MARKSEYAIMKSTLKTIFRFFNKSAAVAGLMLAAADTLNAQTLFVSNLGDGVINEVDPFGNTTFFATASGYSTPRGLAFDNAGDLFVTDQGTGNIYEFVNNAGTLSTTASVFASGLGAVNGLAFDSAGNMYADNLAGTIYEFGAGGQSTFATGLNDPEGLAFNSSGNLFVTSFDGVVYQITPTGNVTTFASLTSNGFGLAFNSSGDLFVGEPNGPGVVEIAPNGSQTGITSGEYSQLAFDNQGDLFATLGNGIFEFTNNDGTLSSDPVPFASGFDNPAGLAFQPAPEPSLPGLLACAALSFLLSWWRFQSKEVC